MAEAWKNLATKKQIENALDLGDKNREKKSNIWFKWLQQDSNPQPLSSQMNTQPFGQTGQMTGLCCIYLHGAFDCVVYLLCHIRILKWIYTL